MSFLNNTNPTTPTTTTTSSTTTRIVNPSGNKMALCMGINNYPDPANRLAGCVNDAMDWAAYLQGKGFSTHTLVDENATSTNFKSVMGNYLYGSKAGDYIVCTYSGHGSNVPDKDGDEADGRDECICLYDRFFIDDEIRELFKLVHPEATLVMLSDSCHSGTVTRAFLQAMGNADERLMPRYLPPKDDVEARLIDLETVNSRIFFPEPNMKEILVAGCLNTEYSYDARINGRNNGAFTSMALQILKSNPPLTFTDFYKKLRTVLPSNKYPQTPQLEGSDTNKNKIMFQ